MSEKQRLIAAIKEFGVVFAKDGEEFTLASGAKSKFYIDFSRVMMTIQGCYAVTEALHKELYTVPFDIIGGPSSGADPIIGAMMNRYISRGSVRGFTIRKEPKGRGPDAGAMFEGYLVLGAKAVVIEDVTTSGGSVLKAIKEVEKVGAKVVAVISLLDREAGATELLKDYNFTSLVKLHELELK